MSLALTGALYGELLNVTEEKFLERVNDAKKIIDWLFTQIGFGKGDKDLDLLIAGGTGRHALAASLLGVQNISYIDLSAKNIDRMKKISRENKISNIEIIHGNIMDVKEEKRFDVCASEGVVQHLPDPTGGLKTLLRTVKSNGHLFFTLYRYGILTYLVYERVRRLHRPDDFGKMISTLNKLSLYDLPISFSSGTLGQYLLDDLFVPHFAFYSEYQVVESLENAGLKILYHDHLPRLQFSVPSVKALYFIVNVPENYDYDKLNSIHLKEMTHTESPEFEDYINETINVLDECIEKLSNSSILERNIFSIGLSLVFDKCWGQKMFEKEACNTIVQYLKKNWLC